MVKIIRLMGNVFREFSLIGWFGLFVGMLGLVRKNMVIRSINVLMIFEKRFVLLWWICGMVLNVASLSMGFFVVW